MFADWLLLILQVIYALCALGLAIYSLNAAWLVWQARGARPLPAPAAPLVWPAVTVQLPLYNERHVAERLIDACAQLDYPADRLEIQVLDDSDDVTAGIIDACARRWQQAGRNVRVIRRAARAGYKAGALAHALPAAHGEFIAIFDADFLPPPSFLRAAIPHFCAPGGSDLAFVQARWDHLNRDYSPLTRGQALALDGHFAIEQAGRQAAGYLLGFNGSAGIWRRGAIEDPAVGGWQPDTLCEDLDLSYRAQLVGWRARYCDDLAAPAEVPPQLAAYKRQQFRWAKGSIQTLRKLGGRVAGGPLTPGQRTAGLIHLASYLVHPLLLLLLLVIPPILLLGSEPLSPIPLIGVTSFGPPLLYAAGQLRLHRDRWLQNWLHLPLLTMLGLGVCFNNTLAVWQGWTTRGGEFQRTPKFRVQRAGEGWRGSAYRLPVDRVMLAEIFLAGYSLFAAYLIAERAGWLAALFMLLYAASFAAVAGVTLWQNRPLPAAGQGNRAALPVAGYLVKMTQRPVKWSHSELAHDAHAASVHSASVERIDSNGEADHRPAGRVHVARKPRRHHRTRQPEQSELYP